MKESRRQFVAALTAGVTGVLAGCGGSDGATPTETATGDGMGTPTDDSMGTPTDDSMGTPTDDSMGTPTDDSMGTPTDDSMGTPTDDSMGTQTATSVAQTVTVGASGGFRFAPASFSVPVGSTVRWEWVAGGHNVTADTTPAGSDWSGTAGSGTFGSGHSYSYTFDTAGDYSYYCAPHRGSGMTGSFTVTQ